MLIGACDPMSWPIRGFRAFLWKRVMGGKVFNATATVPDLDPDVRVYVTTCQHSDPFFMVGPGFLPGSLSHPARIVMYRVSQGTMMRLLAMSC